MSKGRIPDAVFVEQTLNNGGASRHAVDQSPAPSSGYMVGGAPDNSGQKYHEQALAVHEFSARAVRAHAQDIQANVPQTTAPVYQGSWLEGGRVVMDASNHYQDRLQALRIGRERGERAVYDLDSGSDVNIAPGQHKAGAHKASKGERGLVAPSSAPGGAHRYEGKHVAGAHRADGPANVNPFNNPGDRKYVGKHRA